VELIVSPPNKSSYRISFQKGGNAKSAKMFLRSNRLMFGALVCLSSDDFNTLHWATVQNRDEKFLVKGQVDLDFIGYNSSQENTTQHNNNDNKISIPLNT
jgi:hypothetical protein